MDWNIFITILTMVFTELIKRTWRPESKFVPWIAVLLGGLFGVLYGAVMGDTSALMMEHIVMGIAYGGTAIGIYTLGDSAVNGNKWEEY